MIPKLEFKEGEFVQVERYSYSAFDKPMELTWMNALYAGRQDDNHTVCYADGTKEVLRKEIKIRKVQDDS